MSDRRSQPYRDDRRRDRDGDRGGDHRRRSRSPGHRRGYEVDKYSGSRDYREREREERYGGRDRRDWDRGPARRDTRRDDDDRRRDPRRDRDLFDDRRRPRDDRDGDRERDRMRDRDDMRQMERQARQKDASPPPKPREKTPDLTDFPLILDRPRRLTQWDNKPPGYEKITAEQAKLSGMFPLPGAPRAQPMDQSRLQAFMNQPGNQVSQNALKPNSARQSKRLFVSNFPAAATDTSIADFFNLQLNGLNITRGNDVCVSVHISTDRKAAIAEFKTPEDATNALALSGIEMETEAMDTGNGTSNGTSKGLQIARPDDYIGPSAIDDASNEAGLFGIAVPDSPDKISISNIPTFLEEEQVQELLQSFGELRAFVLAKDGSSGQSRGFAFCEYKDASVTNAAVDGLNGMELDKVTLKVARASIGLQQVSGEISVGAMSMMAGTETDTNTSRVLCLMNMITQEELIDPVEAEGKPSFMICIHMLTTTEILEDIRDECSNYGTILDIKMPRPTGGNRGNNGVGKVYIKFETSAAAQQALNSLAGRKFADRTVVASFMGEQYFDTGAW